MGFLHEKIAVIGLGYVGLPLVVVFGEKRPVVGFDINQKRIDELNAGQDLTREVSADELVAARGLSFSSGYLGCALTRASTRATARSGLTQVIKNTG